MKKIHCLLSWLTIILALSLLLLVGFWLIYPYKPFVVNNVTSEIETINPGETYKYSVSYCKYSNLSALVSKTLVNDILIPFSPYESNIPTGCQTRDVYTEIPDYVPSGVYHIHIVSAYQVNPIRNVTVFYETPAFIIN